MQMQVKGRPFKEISAIGVTNDGAKVVMQFADENGGTAAISLPRDQAMKLVELGAAANERSRKMANLPPKEHETITVEGADTGHADQEPLITLTMRFGGECALTFALSHSLARFLYEGLGSELGLSTQVAPPGLRH